jgi:N-acetylneuraminic acid mutarotase
MSSTVSGSNIYTYGGQTNTTELWKFDINTSTWSLLSSTGGPNAFFGHSIYIYNNILYVFGGVSTNKNIWTYNLSTNTWAMLDDVFDKTLLSFNSVIRNNIVFFFNGRYGVVNNDKVLRYKIT